MTTLITGGNGWVPSHIVRRLARRGETVVSYDVFEPDAMLAAFLGDAAANVVFAPGDVTDRARLQAVAAEHGVARIIHAAAITPRLERERLEPQRIIDVNLGGTVNALEVARSLPGFERMVYVSSGAAVGHVTVGEKIDEETPSVATGLYGITKHSAERICRRYAQLFDLDIVAMRPADVYGPMEHVTPGYSGATEMREMLRLHFSGLPILVNSLDGPHLDWTFVEDIAEGIERAWAARRLPRDVYALTSGRLRSIGDVLAAFQRRLPDLRYDPVPAAKANFLVSGDPPGPAPSNARLRADFGWVPPTSFDDGMRRYIDWIEENGPQ